MTTLIDRYVFTVLRRVPEQQRSALWALAAALNNAQPVSSLDQFLFWKEQPPLDLNWQWTNACDAAEGPV